ncbi:MAG: RNA 2',3'-cyclic phosphodiesterase [Bacteroidota bacterium]
MSEELYKRMFLGIPLPEAYVTSIQAFQNALPPHLEIRLMQKETLHITVAFFGKVHEDMLPNLISLIELCLAQAAPFRLEAEKWTLAPRPKEARMIWLSLQRSDLYTRLAHTLIQRFDAIQQVQQFRKKPIPHITVARFKAGLIQEIPGFLAVHLPPIEVSRLVLWESKLLPDGPVYEEVHSFSL